ncbi:MAG: metallopeptidase [Candidatus Aenigmarchaeota archaeon]|nr:metallopeptidase [Candidatus Aenigmarchaeota archaeon]
MIRYNHAPDVKADIEMLVDRLAMGHVDKRRVACIRSVGSGSRRIIARCHVVPRIIQKALGIDAYYVIEVIAEKFDRLSKDEQTKTLIHELMHIPKSFGGGFRHHDYVSHENVEKIFNRLGQV